MQPVRLVLMGVGFSMALSGVMVVLISFAERETVDFISKWLAGNVWGTDWPFIWALAASAVSVTGGIAFIGLMAPHIAKALIGPRNQLFIPVAILIGGWLLVLADTIGRQVADPDGLAAGIVVALIGAPYFIYLLLKK